MGLGDHPETFLLMALCCNLSPSWLKVGGGGPFDYFVSPSPKNLVLGIFSLGQDYWVRTWGLLGRGTGDLDLGLTILHFISPPLSHLDIQEDKPDEKKNLHLNYP